MAKLTVQLLGQFQVTYGEEIISDFASDKVRALLAYLIAEVHCPHRREILADLLWPGKPESSARGNLRRALANLRQAINDHEAVAPVLLVSRQDIQFNQKSSVKVDVHQLNQIYDLKDVAPGNIAHYGSILDIYKGEFLAGFSLKGNLPFEEWVILMREQYARKAFMILERVSNYYENKNEFDKALPFAWRHVELEPWQEAARRQLMRLLAKTGRRDEALQQFENLADTLKNELGISPEPTTIKLYEQIRGGKLTSNDIEVVSKSTSILPNYFMEEHFSSQSLNEPFVAREIELGALNEILKNVLSGQGGIALVGGEAGSGKSTLIREFVRKAQLQHRDLVSTIGYCNAFTGSGDPYLPFREIIYQFSGDIEAQLKAGAISRENAFRLSQIVPSVCDAIIKRGSDLIDRVIPGTVLMENARTFAPDEFSWFQNLKKFIEQKQISRVGGMHPASLLSQVTAVLKEIAEQNPMVIILDDLQWADAGTLSMLFHLGKNLSVSKIMILGAFRTEEVGSSRDNERHPLLPIINELKRDFGEIIINLDLISGYEFVKELIESEPNELGNDFRDQLFNLTHGHALFTVELLRALQDSGILFKGSNGMWRTKQGLRVETLPAKIEGIIAERLGRLPQQLQNILSIASVEGEFFTAEAIAEMENLTDGGISRILSGVLDKQHRLVKAHQVQVLDGKPISTYRFRHILFQKFLYSRLDEIERVRFHGQIGEALEKLVGPSSVEYAVQLARHFDLAKQMEKALSYHVLSGERAIQMAGFPEAISHFERALALLEMIPESPSTIEQELSLQLQLGIAVQNIQGYAHEKVGKAFKRAWELCQKVGDRSKIITTQQLLFSYYANMAEFATAFQIMAFLEEYYNPDEFIHTLQVNWGYGYMDHILGKQKDCLDRFKKAVDLYDPDLHKSFSKRVGMEAGIYCNGWAGLYSIWIGYPNKAKKYIQAALDIAEGYNYTQFTSEANWFAAWTSIELKDYSLAKYYVEKLIEITTREHYFMYQAVAKAFLGRVLVWDGRFEEAIKSIQIGYDMFLQTGAVTNQSVFHYALAEAYRAAGAVQDGLEAVAKSEKFEGEVGEKTYSTAIAKIKGDLLVCAGDEANAEQAYKKSIRMAQAESAKLLELEAAKGLALLLERQGKKEEAHQMLQEVYDWFTEGFEIPSLVEARNILEKLRD